MLASEAYFQSYGVMQRFKHLLLRRYLQAWFPILGRGAARLLYVETHAGRGKHDTGQYGSPLVALETFQTHASGGTLLGKCDVSFLLMEKDGDHANCLRECLSEYGDRVGVQTEVQEGDFAHQLDAALQVLERQKDPPPAFVFVDPFNYNIPVNLLRRVLAIPSCEVLVTFMAQDALTAMRDSVKASAGKATILDGLFGDNSWQTILSLPSFEAQLNRTILKYEQAVGAKWCTILEMHGNRHYALMHFTNNDRGREEVKRAMWDVGKAVGREGQYALYSTDNPDQPALLDLTPDFEPLSKHFRATFQGQRIGRLPLTDWCRKTNYLDSHMNDIIRKGVDDGWIEKHYKGQVGPSMGEITVNSVIQEGLF